MEAKLNQAKSILLVDDDDIFREVLATALGDHEYDVLQAANGVQALDVLRQKSDIGLVLSDIRMPGMDGVELLRQIRLIGNLPVILATGFSEVTETQAAYQLGATGFLAKPFEMGELLELVRSVLSGDGDKSKLCDEDFARILIDDFVSGKVLKHSIFVRLAKDKFVKIAHEGIDLDIARVREYKARGVKHLHLKKSDFREYLSTSLSLAKRVTASKIDQKKKERFLQHTANLILEKVMIEDLDSFALAAAREFFDTSLSIVADEENLFHALTLLNEHSDHVFAHSIGVSMYSIMIARAMEWRSAPTTFRVGLAGLFHDIGLKEIDRKILDTPRPSLSRADRMFYETHATRSTEILSAVGNVPEEVIQAVAQHHEDPNGFGYPRGCKGMEITPLARLLSVADAFCEYAIKNPDYPKGMSAQDALDKMVQFRATALDPTFLKVLQSLVKKTKPQAA